MFAAILCAKEYSSRWQRRRSQPQSRPHSFFASAAAAAAESPISLKGSRSFARAQACERVRVTLKINEANSGESLVLAQRARGICISRSTARSCTHTHTHNSYKVLAYSHVCVCVGATEMDRAPRYRSAVQSAEGDGGDGAKGFVCALIGALVRACLSLPFSLA